MSSNLLKRSIAIEAGLKKRGFDNNILNYVIVGFANFNISQNIYLNVPFKSEWSDIIKKKQFNNVCVCSQSNLRYLYLIVHKDKFSFLDYNDILVVGSECQKYIVYNVNGLKVELKCSASYSRICGLNSIFKKNHLMNENDKNAIENYYSKSSLWSECHVCHLCANKFKSLLICEEICGYSNYVKNANISKNGSRYINTLYDNNGCLIVPDNIKKDDLQMVKSHIRFIIYDYLKTDSKKKQLISYVEWLKANKFANTYRWRDWIITANICIERLIANNNA